MPDERVLIVEDEGIVARSLENILQNNGYEVVGSVPTGEEAIEQTKKHSPDLVLMDIRLAGDIDGTEAAERIHRQYELPIVYLTAHTDPETVEEAEAAEPFAYLTKPVDEGDLVHTLRMVSKKQASLSQERREYEEKLQFSRKRYARLVDTIPDIVYKINPDGEVEFLSESIERLGYDREALIGQPFETILHPDDRGLYERETVLPEYRGRETGPDGAPDLIDERRTGERVTRGLEVRLLPDDVDHPDQTDRDIPVFEVNAAGLHVESDSGTTNFKGTVGLLRDVTERKRLEDDLKEARDYTRGIIDSAASMIVSVDLDRQITEFNPRAEDVFGFDREEVLGEKVDRLYADPETGEQIYEQTIDQGKFQGEVTNITRKGEEFTAYLSTSVLQDAGGDVRGVMGVSRDISEQKQRERELELKERAMGAVREGITIADATGEDNPLIYCNEGFETLTGYDREEVLGKNCRFLQGEDTDAEQVETIRRAIDNEEQVEAVLLNYRKDGSTFWNELSIYPVENEEGTVTHFVGVQNDVTEQEQREEALRERTRALEQSNRQLKQFANIASHDLKQPLRTIASFAELLQSRYGDDLDGQANRYLQRISEGTKNMKELLDGIRRYSKIGATNEDFEFVDLNVVVAEAREGLQREIEDTGTRVDVGDLPTIEGARPLLRELFQNLIDNAITYRSEDPPRIQINREETSEDGVVVRVSDNGIGMAPEYTDQIFEIFERLQSDSEIEGKGLGLAICKQIAKRHDGDIWAESSPGDGTDFFLEFPFEQSSPAE